MNDTEPMSCPRNLIQTLEALGATTAARMLVLMELYEHGPLPTNGFTWIATGFTREILMVFEAEETVESDMLTGKRKDGRIWRLTDKAFSAIASALGAANQPDEDKQDPEHHIHILVHWLGIYRLNFVIRDGAIDVFFEENPSEVFVRLNQEQNTRAELILKACQEVAQICGIAPPILES